MSLKEIKGNEQAIKRLKRNVADERISHAYLFYGPDGVGKELTAKNFAKLLNCRSPRNSDACDFCKDCINIEKKKHPDVIWLRPRGPARIVPIEKVREFQKAVSLKPYEGRWKIGIFLEAHTLQKDAASALLKTLEEPPSHTILILVTSRPEMLLPTIISRCQALRFEPMRGSALKKILQKEYSLTSGEAETLSRLTEGRLGEAVRALRENRLETVSTIYSGLGKSKKDYWTFVAGLLDFIENSIERGEETLEWELAEKGLRRGQEALDTEELKAEARAFVSGELRRRREEMLREFSAWHRDLLVWKMTADDNLLISGIREGALKNQADNLSRSQLEKAIGLIESAIRSVRGNANFHNVMENLLVQLTTL